METEGQGLISPTTEVSVVEGELVATIRELASRGVGTKVIARMVGVARNTVRRYLRGPVEPGAQTRPAARRLSDARREEARTLYEGAAEGNAVVVHSLLQKDGVRASVRTVERAVADLRRASRAVALATVRVESPPGDQLQIDFRSEAGVDWRGRGPRVLPRRGVELLAPAVRQSVPE
jgi:transposase